jgi:hypothetical protein
LSVIPSLAKQRSADQSRFNGARAPLFDDVAAGYVLRADAEENQREAAHSGIGK